MFESQRVGDAVTAVIDRSRDSDEGVLLAGMVEILVHGPDGELKHRSVQPNLITTTGDAYYASRGSGSTAIAVPTGMILGTGTTAVAKTGSGAAIVTYVANSNQAISAPSVSGNVVTFSAVFAAGKGTSGTAISEVALVNSTIATDATVGAANTISRALLASPAAKAAGDSLTIQWTHSLLGS